MSLPFATCYCSNLFKCFFSKLNQGRAPCCQLLHPCTKMEKWIYIYISFFPWRQNVESLCASKQISNKPNIQWLPSFPGNCTLWIHLQRVYNFLNQVFSPPFFDQRFLHCSVCAFSFFLLYFFLPMNKGQRNNNQFFFFLA
jgi:hypothetical protein